MAGCLDNYIPLEKYESKVSELEEANIIIDTNAIEIVDLKEELNLTEDQLEKYNNLIDSLNDLLSNVYYGYASNENWESDGFTAFSIEYKGKFYLITAGHCVHYKDDKIDAGVFTKIKVKNFKGDWIYPKLLKYENDYDNNRDYAILYSDKIIKGLEYDLNNSYPKFILGNLNKNILKELNIYNLLEGESGSPVVDLDGEVIGIATGNFVDIDLVLEAIDELE